MYINKLCARTCNRLKWVYTHACKDLCILKFLLTNFQCGFLVYVFVEITTAISYNQMSQNGSI